MADGLSGRNALLRHLLATIAYRTQRALGDAPAGFADYRAAEGSRSPHDLVKHMSEVLVWANTFVRGGEWQPLDRLDFEAEVERFHGVLEVLHELFGDDSALEGVEVERLLQGPLADVLTHIGQIAMLRRLAGSPVRGESYYRADVSADRLGPDQPEPVAPFSR